MTQGQNKPPTMTDDEYTIHALNIQGTFFERKCQDVVHSAKDWQIQDTNYPVTYGGQNSNLDIWAQRNTGTDPHLLLLIECKKNNPGFIDWVFFRQPAHRIKSSQLQKLQVRNNVFPLWGAFLELHPLVHDLSTAITDEAWETKGDYLRIKNQQDKTKTSNKTITEAATQVAIATQALMQQELDTLKEISDRNLHFNVANKPKEYPPYYQLFVFPTIVTTANLYICEFEDADIDLTTGEIPLEKPRLVPCPYLVYNYPVPPALQLTPSALHLSHTHDTLKQLARMPIFVVQSEAFPTFLDRLTLPERNENESGNVWYELKLKPGEIEAV